MQKFLIIVLLAMTLTNCGDDETRGKTSGKQIGSLNGFYIGQSEKLVMEKVSMPKQQICNTFIEKDPKTSNTQVYPPEIMEFTKKTAKSCDLRRKNWKGFCKKFAAISGDKVYFDVSGTKDKLIVTASKVNNVLELVSGVFQGKPIDMNQNFSIRERIFYAVDSNMGATIYERTRHCNF